MKDNIERQLIEVDGLKIAETVIGAGKALLMLHGWGANIDLLNPLAQKMIRLGYCIYMLDMPGFGDSDEPPSAWTVFDYAKFTLKYLDHHQLEQVYLFGHSFGGRLGLVLGADYPERILKMGLADSAGIITSTPKVKQLRLSVYKTIRDGLYQLGGKSLADSLRDWYGNRYGSADYQQVSGIMRETFVKVVNEDLLPYAKRVSIPTILIWGEKDEDTPLWQGQLLERTISDAGLVIFEGAGHYSYLEQPERTAKILDALFKSE